MAVAAPARKSAAAPAPAPSRTAPPRRKAAPAKRAPAKRAPAKRISTKRASTPSAASARSAARTRTRTRASAAAAPATAARRAPARTPQRARPKTKPNRAAAAGQLIPIAVGHTAATVRRLPDSGLVLRMTRGRAWIAVLGALLAGIVALNVATLSFAASSGKIDEQATTLEREISRRESLLAQRFSLERIGNAAAAAGLAMPTTQEPTVIQASRDDIANAAARLAALGGG
jgi:hypothetical protein